MAPSATAAPAAPPLFPLTEVEFQRFRALVHRETGIALADTKRELLRSRLGKRLRYWGYRTFTEYWRHLRDRDPRGDELRCLINAITTNKTEFFREPGHFDFLKAEILVPLAREVAAGRPLRIWSAGCSTGEEAYSVAISVLEALPRGPRRDVRILASDIDTDVLGIAQRAVYPEEATRAIPLAWRQQYFARGHDREGTVLHAKPEVRDLVTVRRINLRDESWPIRTRFDAIFCRNVLIYFDKALQQRVVGRFVELLQPGGCLFLGHSESLLGIQNGLVHAGSTVYRKAGRATAVRECANA